MSSYFILIFIFLHFCSSETFFIHNKFLTLYRKMKQNLPPSYDPLEKQKLIISAPAGLHGFYLFGVSAFIKENYNLTNYIFSGASAGSWNSLFLSFKGNDTEFIEHVLTPSVYNVTTLLQIEKNMKNSLLEHYKENDFDLHKLYLGVSVVSFPFRVQLKIYDNFKSLKDTLDGCIASSHIPFITGGLIHIYKNRISIDGGLFSYPYIKFIRPEFIIEPNVWNSSLTKQTNCSLKMFFQSHTVNNNITQLFEAGYNDSLRNKAYLDEIFL